MTKRDLLLDRGRGLVMMYIVCVVHVLWWLSLGANMTGSFALIEMPIIFFIAGASQRYSRKASGVWATVKNRSMRVLAPYYVYALVSVLIVMACALLKGETVSFTLKDALRIVATCNIVGTPFVWHLWFIIPFLVISISFVWQMKCKNIFGGVNT